MTRSILVTLVRVLGTNGNRNRLKWAVECGTGQGRGAVKTPTADSFLQETGVKGRGQLGWSLKKGYGYSKKAFFFHGKD